jgi:hypothetical protein
MPVPGDKILGPAPLTVAGPVTAVGGETEIRQLQHIEAMIYGIAKGYPYL